MGMRLRYFFVVFFFGSFTLFLVGYVNLKASVQPNSMKAANMISASIKPPRTNHLMHEPKSPGLLLSGLRTHAPMVKPHSTGSKDVAQFKTWRGPPNRVVEKELALKKMSPMKMDYYHAELDDVHNSTDADASKNIFESAGHSCKDSLCLNFLTEREKEAFHWCLARVTKRYRNNHLDMRKINQASGACHFRYGKGTIISMEQGVGGGGGREIWEDTRNGDLVVICPHIIFSVPVIFPLADNKPTLFMCFLKL